MTDDTEQIPEEPGTGGTSVAVIDRPGGLAVPVTPEQKRAELRKDRLLLPFLLPVGAILAVALFAINISRIFLAASQDSKDPAVISAVIVTLGILAGATAIAAIPKLRTSTLVLTVCGVAAFVLLSGSLVLGSAENKEVKSAEPPGPAINTLEVDALASLSFQAKNFDVPAGINEIKYIDKGGSHTLVFAEPELGYVNLAVPTGTSVSKALLVENKKYTIYCTIPGHRSAGMEATLTVGKPGTTKEAGTATETPSTTLVGPAAPKPNGQSENDPAAQGGTTAGN